MFHNGHRSANMVGVGVRGNDRIEPADFQMSERWYINALPYILTVARHAAIDQDLSSIREGDQYTICLPHIQRPDNQITIRAEPAQT